MPLTALQRKKYAKVYGLWRTQLAEKVCYAKPSRLNDKGLGSSPFSKGLADSKGSVFGRPSQWTKSPLRSALGRG